MKVIDTVNHCIKAYPSLYLMDTFEKSKFAVLHHYFCVLGNGIEWAHTKKPKQGGYLTDPSYYKKNGDYVRKYDLSYGKEKCRLSKRYFTEVVYDVSLRDTSSDLSKLHMFNIPDLEGGRYAEKIRGVFRDDLDKLKGGWVEAYSKVKTDAKYVASDVKESNKDMQAVLYDNPYPNFDKKYSPFWKIEPNLMQDDWRFAGIEHMEHWLRYFNDDERVKSYHYYSKPEELKKFVTAQYPEIDVDKINKDYETKTFNGSNWEDWSMERWNKERKRTIKFIEDTLKRLKI